MQYCELHAKYRAEARELIKGRLEQWERDVAREQGREPIYMPMTNSNELYREQLEVAEFEIVVDEVTKREELILI